MRFYEVDSSVDAIMSAAMLAQTRASSSGKQGKLSMNGFLQMLANSGIMMDYDGFKTVYDTNPQLANVIAQFNKDSITFVGDSDDEDAEFEPTQGEMPADERVAKMAKSAMKTREFVEATVTENAERIIKVTNIDFAGPSPDKMQLPTSVTLRLNVPYDADEDDIDDMVADDLEDRYGVKVSGFETQFTEGELTEFHRHQDIVDQIVDMQPENSNEIIRMAQKLGAPDRAIDDILQAVLDKVNIDEAELPPHLSKMFGKDGSQVDTRTEVMRQMRDIVANKESKPVVFGDGKMRVDMYTASVLVQIYDKVNDKNKEAIVQRVGTKEKFTKLMPKLFNMIGEGSSPHPKGSKKYKAHMAAKHANMNEGKSMEDKIAADIKAGLSTDVIIGKYANRRTDNTDEIRKIIQRIKFRNFVPLRRNE